MRELLRFMAAIALGLSVPGCGDEAVGTESEASATDNFIYVGTSYGYAGAVFDFTSASTVSISQLIVSDWGCDAHPVYAYFLWSDGTHWDSTPTKRYDYSGCDTGDDTEYDNLHWDVGGTHINYMAVVICRQDGPCQASFVSARNPYAPH